MQATGCDRDRRLRQRPRHRPRAGRARRPDRRRHDQAVRHRAPLALDVRATRASPASRSGPRRSSSCSSARRRDWPAGALLPTNDEALRGAAAAPRPALRALPRRRAAVGGRRATLLDKALHARSGARRSASTSPHCYGAGDGARPRRPGHALPGGRQAGRRLPLLGALRLQAVRRARSRASCGAASRGSPRPGLDGEVFDLVPGADSQIYAYCTYVDARGEPRGGRHGAQAPPEPALLRRARASPRWSPTARRCARRRSSCSGASASAASRVAEFKRDPRDGRFRFLEVNGRSVLYNALLRRAGLDLAGAGVVRRTSTGAPSGARPQRLARRVDQPARRPAVHRGLPRSDERAAPRGVRRAVPPAADRGGAGRRATRRRSSRSGGARRATARGRSGTASSATRRCGRRTSRPTRRLTPAPRRRREATARNLPPSPRASSRCRACASIAASGAEQALELRQRACASARANAASSTVASVSSKRRGSCCGELVLEHRRDRP